MIDLTAEPITAVFRIPVLFRIRIRLFSLVRIRIHEKKRPKTEVQLEKKFSYFIFSTIQTVLFGQAPIKPNQKHH